MFASNGYLFVIFLCWLSSWGFGHLQPISLNVCSIVSDDIQDELSEHLASIAYAMISVKDKTDLLTLKFTCDEAHNYINKNKSPEWALVQVQSARSDIDKILSLKEDEVSSIIQAFSVFNTSMELFIRGKGSEAAVAAKNSIAILQKHLGKDSYFNIRMHFFYYVFANCSPEERSTALKSIDNILRICSEKYTTKSHIYAKLLHMKSDLLLSEKQYSDARDAVKRSISTQINLLGESHFETISSRLLLVRIYIDSEKLDSAKNEMKEIDLICKGNYLNFAELVRAEYLSTKASFYIADKNYELAQIEQEKMVQCYSERYKKDDAILIKEVNILISIYEKLDKKELVLSTKRKWNLIQE